MMYHRMNIRRVLPTLWLLPLLAAGCGGTGPDGSGGAGGTISTASTSSSTGGPECATYGTTKAGDPCATDCDCACHACGTQTTNGVTKSVCTAACEPVDGGL